MYSTAFFCPGSPVSLPSNSSEAYIYRCSLNSFSVMVFANLLALEVCQAYEKFIKTTEKINNKKVFLIIALFFWIDKLKKITNYHSINIVN